MKEPESLPCVLCHGMQIEQTVESEVQTATQRTSLVSVGAGGGAFVLCAVLFPWGHVWHALHHADVLPGLLAVHQWHPEISVRVRRLKQHSQGARRSNERNMCAGLAYVQCYSNGSSQ